MKLTDAEILDTISEHAGTEIRSALWLRQIRYNEEHYGFKSDIDTLHLPPRPGEKALVLGAGPGFKRFGTKDLKEVLSAKRKPILICADGALPTLASIGQKADFIFSVDAHPIVANFYRRSKSILEGTTVILSTTINKDVVEECKSAGARIGWFQGFFPDARFHREGILGLNTGGNVGTTCYSFAAYALGCRPIGLMGLEFAWSDETPLISLQYYEEIKRIVGEENVPNYFRKVLNTRDHKTYLADPIYHRYLLFFQEIWDSLPLELRESTYNLTVQGILEARGLKTISARKFAKL